MSIRTLDRMTVNKARVRERAFDVDTSRKRPNRQGKNDEVEDALGKWFTAVRAKKQTVTGPMLMKKAQQFGEQLGTDFSPSNGWLSRWKNRARIRFKRAHGEKSSANFEAAEEWLSMILFLLPCIKLNEIKDGMTE